MHDVIANGAAIPALGFGTFRMSDAEVAEVQPKALKLGFRHVDTAQVYGNEAAVGAADLLQSVEESLKKLGVDHVDLLLLHWPHGNDPPREVQITELNKTVSKGMTRHIGVSNYNVAGMHEAAQLSDAPLVTNQVEYHPYLSQAPVLQACADLGMALTGYYGMADGAVPQDEVLKDIGAAHGKTAAQVALRWLVQQPRVVTLSKTAKLARLPENFGIFDFELSAAEMTAIHGLGCQDGRIISPKDLAPDWD